MSGCLIAHKAKRLDVRGERSATRHYPSKTAKVPERMMNRMRQYVALEERIGLVPSRRLRFALALEALQQYGEHRAIRLLDAGCGDGRLSLAIAQRHPSWEIVGVDLLEAAVLTARKRARHLGVRNARFVRGDLVNLQSEKGFDAVLAIECLTEISDDHGALGMMATALVEGGILIVHVPQQSWTPILPGSPPTWRHEVRHGYSADEITQALRTAGVGAIHIRPTMQGSVTLAQEVQDRIKTRSLALRALVFPALVAAVRLERWGLTWGPDRAFLAIGLRKPSSIASR